jgi:dTDP-4-amino-4,6-dideoxygalactose transaminase
MLDQDTPTPNLYASEPIPKSAQAEIEAFLSSGDLFRYTTPETSPVALLELDFAQALGSKYALAVSSCSAALFLSLKALNLPRDAKVLIPAFTFAAVPSSVVHADCIPVLCEVGDNYRICLHDFEAKISDVDAVLISHMRGHTSDMDAILELAQTHSKPVIEDAAHSLGTTWNGRNIGTLGRAGCFSFQSYKMLNAGEGGILVTDDADLIAQAVIMSGAYEHNWKSHELIGEVAEKWQNKLPLYNLRMQNISACIVRAQLPELTRRVQKGRENHDYVAAQLNASNWFNVPDALPPENRAPDSIQFNLLDFSETRARAFMDEAKANGVGVSVFGLSQNNARAFWNWKFLNDIPELPMTRKMLFNACDVRLPARLTKPELDFVSDALLRAAETVKSI